MAKHYPNIPPPSDASFRQRLNTELQLIVDQLGQVDMEGLASTIVIQTTHAQRPSSYTIDAGTILLETDRTVIYVARSVSGAIQWVWIGGEMRGTISPDQKPTDLGINDAGFLFVSTDFNRKYRWSGTAWADAPGEDARDYIAFFRTAPGTGWAPCDGTAAVNISTPTGGVAAITIPDLNDGTYVRGAAAYSGPAVTPPIAPTISGSTANTTATNIAAATGVTVDSAVTGISVDAHATANDTDVTGGGTRVTTATHTVNDAGHTHNITDPTHNHTQNAHNHGVGTLVVSTTGQPQAMDFLAYLRL